MKKKDLKSIGCDYYLSIKQVAELEKCPVQNIYSRIKGKSIMFYWNNIYHIHHFGEITLLVPADSNTYLLNNKFLTLTEWEDI